MTTEKLKNDRSGASLSTAELGSTYHDDRNPVDVCKERGWVPGTQLTADGEVIEITELSGNQMFAISLTGPLKGVKSSYLLSGIGWGKVLNPQAHGRRCGASAGLCEKPEYTVGEGHYCRLPLLHDGLHVCRCCGRDFNNASTLQWGLHRAEWRGVGGEKLEPKEPKT